MDVEGDKYLALEAWKNFPPEWRRSHKFKNKLSKEK